MRNAFQEDIANNVLLQLEASELSIRELSDKVDRSYHSVRAVVRQLEEEGLITPSSNRYRNTTFRLASGDGPNRVMPMVNLGGSRYKLIQVLAMRHSESSPTASAVLRIPMHITRILNCAIKIKAGTDQQRTLRLIKVEMQNDLDLLKSAVSVYEQIINDPRNWNPETLRRYNNDVQFDKDEVISSYNHYFPSRNTETGERKEE
jgi:hypothetical protein